MGHVRDIPLLHQLALHRPGASRNESFEVIRLIIHMGDQPRPSHAIITAVRATSCGMHLVVAQVIMFDCAVSQGPVAFIWCVLGEDVGLFFVQWSRLTYVVLGIPPRVLPLSFGDA